MNTRTRILLLSTTLVLGVIGWGYHTSRNVTAPAPRAAVAIAMAAPTERTRPAHTQVAPIQHHGPAAARSAAAPRPALQAKAHTAAQGLHRLPVQHFSVDARRDTLLRTANGCTVRVPAGSFVDAQGTPVNGPVTMQVQEALTPADLLLGGLATVYQGKALESGGSFCITASARGQAVQLAPGMALDMAVPSRTKKAGMKLFPGAVEQGQVLWQEPEPLDAPVAQVVFGVEGRAMIADTLTTNVTYTVEGFEDPQDAPVEVTDRVSEVAWANGGLMLKRDSSFTVGRHRVHFYANEAPTSSAVVPLWQARTFAQPVSLVGTNTFQEDPAVNYVFRVKRLGWANIDRLLNDKRTRPVDMLTTIADTTDLKDVRISLVMKSHNLYLPGYERADGSYGFSHGDFERMQLPVGAKALVVATAQRHGKPCYALQTVDITPTAQVDLHLQPTTDAELRAALMEAL
jgi:hypothetical protein